MKIKFCGADKTVTGSKHLLDIGGKKILLDCGMVLGDLKRNFDINSKFLFDPKELDCVILSHAHLDHSGLLPVLVKQGYRGNIYCTDATKDLAKMLLLDSAHVQLQDIDHRYRYYGENIEPLFKESDVLKTAKQMKAFEYDKWSEILPDISLKMVDAGHILGSALVNIQYKENEKKRILCFTGDLGRKGLPIIHDPVQVTKADVLITESTYAGHLHDSFDIVYEDLRLIVNDVYKRNGKIIIPSFALERVQELIYVLHKLYDKKLIPEMPVFVDSPLAIEISKVFHNYPKYYDKETFDDFLNNLISPFGFRNLHYIEDKEESKQLNYFNKPCIIIAASGMCEAGRIVHHLKYNIENPNNLILVIGFMAAGTLGRKIVEHAPFIRIFDKNYRLKADVVTLNSFSGHADKLDLMDYIKNIADLKRIFVVHGEETETSVMRDNIYNILKFQGKVDIPNLGEEYDVEFE